MEEIAAQHRVSAKYAGLKINVQLNKMPKFISWQIWGQSQDRQIFRIKFIIMAQYLVVSRQQMDSRHILEEYLQIKQELTISITMYQFMDGEQMQMELISIG